MNKEKDEIRRNAIDEIKEKLRKNPNFLSPVNKERLEYQEKLKFTNGNDFTNWMQQVGIMKNPTSIDNKNMEKRVENAKCKTYKEYRDKCAQKSGFKNCADRYSDYRKEYSWNKLNREPMEFNEYCASHFGDFTESLMIQTFEDAIRMPNNNPGFDWTCKRGDKIDNKGRCLSYSDRSPNWSGWHFPIRHNNIADWFILSAWDNRESKNPLHVWAFHKNDIVRERKFWKRESFLITNTPECLKEFEKYEVTNRLYKLKELCNRLKNID